MVIDLIRWRQRPSRRAVNHEPTTGIGAVLDGPLPTNEEDEPAVRVALADVPESGMWTLEGTA